MSPEVSVIIPAYNRRSVLGRAVESVLSQQGVAWELIVVDDCSTDPDEALYTRLESLGHTVLRLPANVGPGAARNRGVERSRGEWLAFLDSDDHWLPGKLALHLTHLKASALSIGQTDEIWYRQGVRVVPAKPHRISGGDLLTRSLRAVCVSSSTVVLRRELFIESGGFDESMFVCEDYDLWLRLSAGNRFEHLPEALVVKYGGHHDQLSQALPAMDRYRISSIVKGLCQGWLARGDQENAALAELQRKLRILEKGSAKRQRLEEANLCRQLSAATAGGHYRQALELCNRLVALWPTRPNW